MKTTSYSHSSLPIIGSSIVFGVTCLFGQQAENSVANMGDLDPLKVRAERLKESSDQISAFLTDTPLVDIPQSLSVMTQQEILDRGFQSIGDIVEYTPGVTNSQGEGHRDAIVFRGQRSTADFFVDGMRDDVQYYRPIYNIERLEILRGPNALFFGRGGTGGVLNRVMKKPVLGANFTEVIGEIDTFGAFGSQYDYNNTSEDSALRLNMFFDSLSNHRDFYDGERIGINPTWMLQLNEDTSLDFSLEYMDHERFIDRGIPSLNGRPAYGVSGTTFGDSELNFNQLEAYTFRVNLDHQFSDIWSGRASAFFGTYDKLYQNVYPTSYDGTDVTVDGYVDSTDRDRFQLSGDLIGNFTTGSLAHKLVIGAEYLHTSSDQDRFTETWTGGNGPFTAAGFRMSNGVVLGSASSLAFDVLNDDTNVTIDSYSLILHDEIAINDQWDVILGARLETFDIDVKDVKTPANSASRKDTEISPRLGLIFKPAEDVSIYGSFSETFLPRSGEQYANLSTDLDPDTFTNLEAGVKWDINEESSFTLSVFQIEQTSIDEPLSLTYVEVDTETVGFELTYQGRINDWWAVDAGYAYLDGEIAGSSNDPREQPDHILSLWNSFKATSQLGFGLGMIYQSSQFASSDNAVVLPSFVRFDAAAYYDIDESSRIQLNIENLLDTDYYPSSHNNNNITVGAPLSAKLMYSKKF